MKIKFSLLTFLAVLGIAGAGLIFFSNQKSEQTRHAANLPKAVSIDIGHGINMELVLINPGLLTMGSSLITGEGDEAPEHKVTITKPFYLGKYEVTQEQWEELMEANPSKFKGDKRPVDTVSWDDSQLFLKKLQDKTGSKFTMPTEARWEFAARAGTSTRWDFGNDESILGDYAWFQDNANAATHPVGQKKPNAWGLYDMYGNVQEWCNDWYATPYPKGDVSDPQGPNSGDSRVLRGGAWGDDPSMVRSAYRNASGTDAKTPGIGVRVVMVID
ncbi:formylglycine-generating enzyme family protein [Paenibacillus sp. UNC451MF]|uniref:formylglycine-generating enzyme family protein n=1 Tax=Paenibacillus sp. UNC451MF TaxID=1449063 RepID=UPI0004900E7E|nr:formylglycine-generating enzyme family protein [Paenibacillus sp. UNC451MF]